MERIITIKQGEEFKVSINGNGIVEDDFFYPQYKQAAMHVEQIVSSINKEKYGNDKFDYDCEKDYLNNIIAFCGERGSGKTTAMKTFSYALSNNVNNAIFAQSTRNIKFHNMKTIDPSCFESIHDILSIVVARMFKDFENIYDNDEMQIPEDLKCEILKLFQVVYRNLTMLQNTGKYIDQEYEYDGDVQKLSNIASSSNLKEHLYALIEKYLILKKSQYLLIMIDDIDLNIQSAYKLSEEVRRYLSIPNVIIVMAIRIEQLSYCVKKELAKDFSTLMNLDKRYESELNTMANKYLNKLIPESRRIMLPDLRDSLVGIEDNVIVKYYTNEQGNVENDLANDEGKPLESAILKFIYKATGAMFIQKKGEVHPIIPSTLRELIVLYDYLGNMNVKEKMTRNEYMENLSMLHEYLLNVWCKNNLNSYLLDIIKSWDAKRLEDKNRYICEQIQLMVEMFKSGQIIHEFQKGNSLIYHEKWIFDKLEYANRQSKTYSFSFGEVLNLLMDLDEFVKIKDIENFISCSLMLYTTLLNKLKHQDEIDPKNREYMEPKQVNAIIAGNIWGNRLEDIVKKEKVNNQLQSRVVFKYNILAFLVDNYGLELNENHQLYMSDASFKKIVDANNIELLYIVGSMSHFGTKDSNCSWNDQLIADNRIVKSNAIFKFDNIFLMSSDSAFILDKIGFESLSVESFIEAKLNELQDTICLNTNYFIDVVHNPELSRHVLEELMYKKSNKRFGKNAEGVYAFLLETILKSSMIAHEIILGNEESSKDIEDKQEKGKAFDYITEHFDNLANYAENREFDLGIESRAILGELKVSRFKARCKKMINFLEANSDKNENFASYKKIIEELDSKNEKFNSKDNTSDELIIEYNKYWNIIDKLVK